MICLACKRALYTECMREPCDFRRRIDESSARAWPGPAVRKTSDLDADLRRLGVPQSVEDARVQGRAS